MMKYYKTNHRIIGCTIKIPINMNDSQVLENGYIEVVTKNSSKPRPKIK